VGQDFILRPIFNRPRAFSAHQDSMKYYQLHAWVVANHIHVLLTPSVEVAKIVRYIENNPVTAGLALEPARFPWSSAAHRR
jgi:hypothetical protein